MHAAIEATNAVVTLDVGLPGIVWGWIITMNMWAKSIGTGVIFLLFYLLKKYPNEAGYLRFPVTVVSLVFIHIFLLFTVIDLHHIFRFWHIFTQPHFTSAITVGAWIVTGLVALLFLMAFTVFIKKNTASFDKMLTWAVVISIPVTLYTAAIMAEATARELWQMPTEAVQMLLAATLTGSATLILMGGRLSYEAKRDLGLILGLSAFVAFIVYMSEMVFGPMKGEEIIVTLQAVKGAGQYTTMFWIGQAAAFILPMVLVLLSISSRSESLLKLASILAIAGLWIVKYVWLVIPQLLNLS
ncbi:NrfD/PsrC family molybdoenzyme membrane anchor subunit [Sulfurimonas sp. HSL-1716]|uniref:NrfD/PsrC family molybdoenzyme membrane anchor subunit n=1 Tax=Hydrocurvibacter sulfurireducens TaxID=3131937 RepID=UPI0031F9B40D